MNRQHLSDRTPWLLVQPSGIFPLVGPVFTPGKGACWTCLADRMKRNREVKALLDRGQARCVAVSPWPGTRSARVASSSQPSRSRKPSLPTFVPICGITSSASTCWVRPLRSITWRPVRNVRVAAVTNCEIPSRAPVPLRSDRDKLVMTSGGTGPLPEGDGCTFSKAREPADRSDFAPRADRSRPAFEHQLPCDAQFFGARQDGS